MTRLCLIGFKHAQYASLERTVGFENVESQHDSIGWCLTGAFGLVLRSRFIEWNILPYGLSIQHDSTWFSNYIIAFGQSSRIIEQGTSECLETNGGYVENLATRYKSEGDAAGEIDMEEKTQKRNPFATTESDHFLNEAASLNRQTGDASVYHCYFASIGWVANGLFFLCVIAGICSKLLDPR
ncbi:hypothetical protein DSL72_000517 [Monilinia vaccinii-corymbosi]|uniref:Uncharacterized protein n=1 Tax=Monilinia vaccinii-corymbosi TaxID=61207 RepID=A0A8A3P8J8_9HELO|nr:hypothetical protein DSL72_000517 [Monilinia vaccinii-corymbosi]